jgi:hypothetical protein
MAAKEYELVEGCVMRPGDRLLVRLDRGADPTQIREMRDRLAERFPGIEVTVMVADQFAVERGEQ